MRSKKLTLYSCSYREWRVHVHALFTMGSRIVSERPCIVHNRLTVGSGHHHYDSCSRRSIFDTLESLGAKGMNRDTYCRGWSTQTTLLSRTAMDCLSSHVLYKSEVEPVPDSKDTEHREYRCLKFHTRPLGSPGTLGKSSQLQFW